MNSNSALRYLTALLALCYPLTAHLAIWRHSLALTLTAMAIIAAAVLLPALVRGRAAAWIAQACITVFLAWLASVANQELALYAPPVVAPAFFSWVFGHTLGQGRTPLIAQFVRLHSPPDSIDPQVWPYARRLTWLWTLLLGGIALTNLVLGALAQPNGLLLIAGVTPPIGVAQRTWSWFAHLGGYLLVAACFVFEYVYRRHRFPQQPYRNFFDFLARTLASSPRLLR